MNIVFAGELNLFGRGFQRRRAMAETGHCVAAVPLAPVEWPPDYKHSIWRRIRWKAGFPADVCMVNQTLYSAAVSFRPEVVWIEKGNVIRPATLARIKTHVPGAILASYSEDDMFARHNRSLYYTAGLKYYDIIFTTKSYNCNANELPALGAQRVIFVDKAFDVHAHRAFDITGNDVEQYGGDVGFIGTYERPRAGSLLYLAKNNIRVRVWGSGWARLVGAHPNLIVENRGIYGDDYCKGICATKINISFLRKVNRDLQTDRTMEIPACGAFMLTERTDEHRRLFEEDVEAVYFDSDEELLEKVRYYLVNDVRRKEIAAAGRRRCETSGYSHHDRLSWMFAQLQNIADTQKSRVGSIKFSIVIPTYNEERDIARTLDAVTALDYQDKEVVVVDDSTDTTPEIVKRYASKGVRLIRPGRRSGRCEARNLGILEATGEVVVVLNADVRPDSDFLRRLAPYYSQGYDYVLVNSSVENSDELFARYVDAMAVVDQGDDPFWMEWTEGFSCRRELAIRVGLFPTGFAVPICAGEDGFFGANLRALGARKKIDFSIAVGHVAPGALAEYWHIRKGRGKGSPQVRRFLQKWPIGMIAAWASLRIVKTLVYIVLVAPAVYLVWRATRHSKRGLRDLVPFLWAWLIEQVAFHVGEWESIFEIRRAEKRLQVCRA